MARQIRLWIDSDRCQVCDVCMAAVVCKVRAIVRLDPDESPYLDTSRCFDCRLCLVECPCGAVVFGETL